MEKRVGVLLKDLFAGNAACKKELQLLLNFDDLNMDYFLILYRKFLNGGRANAMTIASEKSQSDQAVYPTAIASVEMLRALPLVHYHHLKSNKSAGTAMLWVKKMQAGTGSSIVRKDYLAALGSKRSQIGAKGTDLFITDGEGNQISLVEAQIMQAMADLKNSAISGQCLHDIVSVETSSAIDSIWEKNDGACQKMVDSNEHIFRGAKSFQYHIPTINEQDEVSFNRKAPGGHALFGVEAILAAYRDQMKPDSKGLKLISSIGNGEDLSSGPDDLMVSWMIDNEIPIAMVTTTKTEIDLKGGQIALAPSKDRMFVTMMEKAQADEAGQGELFMELGLRDGDGDAFFNTNMALINYDVLSPMIKKLVSEVGEDKFFEIIAPDLIVNSKKQKDSDGKIRSYRQLEGAMGTVYLNLDRYWRTHFNKPMVHFINVDRRNRTKFFSPIKTAFDFFMQFHSDRFEFDKDSYRLINKVPEGLPQVVLKDDSYKEVQNVLNRFADCSVIKLDQLEVSGLVSFAKCKLIGRVEIDNQSDKIFLLHDKYPQIENLRIIIKSSGEIEVKPLV